jgi:hypothetical protein
MMRRLQLPVKAAKAVLATLEPLVRATEQRRGAIRETSWRSPYILGFLATLTNLLAARSALDPPGSTQLASIQTTVWASLSGQREDRVGEDICLLSALQDAAFLDGCQNAVILMQGLSGGSLPLELFETGYQSSDDQQPEWGVSDTARRLEWSSGNALVPALWQRYFDDYLQQQ